MLQYEWIKINLLMYLVQYFNIRENCKQQFISLVPLYIYLCDCLPLFSFNMGYYNAFSFYHGYISKFLMEWLRDWEWGIKISLQFFLPLIIWVLNQVSPYQLSFVFCCQLTILCISLQRSNKNEYFISYIWFIYTTRKNFKIFDFIKKIM